MKYGGLSKSLIPRQLLTSVMVGRDVFALSIIPLWMKPSLVPLHRVTSWLYSSKLEINQTKHYNVISKTKTCINVPDCFIIIKPLMIWSVYSPIMLLGLLVTHHAPSGEPGLVADERRVFWVSAPQQRVGAHVALTLACGKVPVRDCKVLIAG